MPSIASRLACLEPEERQGVLAGLAPEKLKLLRWDWRFWGRPEQIAPAGRWNIWLINAGRGFGKTRAGAEWIREGVDACKGSPLRVALIAKTPADARKVMLYGESGLMNISPPWNKPRYNSSKLELLWPCGCLGAVYSSKEFDTLRGPQHHRAWADELASWIYPQATWDNLMLGLRLGDRPQTVVTTTPRPLPVIKDLIARSGQDVVITGGSTYENYENISPSFIEYVIRRYEGTTLGQQELYAKLLGDDPRALWSRAVLEKHRVDKRPDQSRIVVAIDPPAKSTEGSAEAGIIVAGIGRDDKHGYVIDDSSVHGKPDVWGRAAVAAYHKFKADRIIAESNNGGEMVEHVIRTFDRNIPFKMVWASRGKDLRAEPITALYEQGRIHHVGFFGALEDQLVTWVPGEGKSPDRLDAAVWALTELMIGPGEGKVFRASWGGR